MSEKRGFLLDAFQSPNKRVRSTTAAASPPFNSPDASAYRLTPNNAKVPNVENEKKIKLSKKSVFNDPIHGNITMSGLCLRIIDTKEFQRLRHLKQLGTCNYVYPGATHTRFEHSIGVAHYAEKIATVLKENQPDLGIDDKDILCVKVAGLCHDLGHGPFSHVFDGVFMTRMNPTGHWRHEDWSVEQLELILERNKIDKDLQRIYGLEENDLLFIKEIIRGVKEVDRRGRSSQKFYLYDIVNNMRSGLDVDKLDYFRRDMQCTRTSSTTCNFDRFIENGRVCAAEPIQHTAASSSAAGPGEQQQQQQHFMICYPEKMVKEAVDVFQVRFKLHQTVYTHKTVKSVEFMITDALEYADPYIKIRGTPTAQCPEGWYKMSQCVTDAVALSNLDDRVLYLISNSADPNLSRSKAILDNVDRRRFYKHIGRTPYQRDSWIFKASNQEIEDHLIALSQKLYEKAKEMEENRSRAHTAAAAVGGGGSFLTSSQTGCSEDNSNNNNNNTSSSFSTGHTPLPSQGYYGMLSQDTPQHIYADFNEVSQDGFGAHLLSMPGSASKNHSTSSSSSSANNGKGGRKEVPQILEKGDIIVDKMHIHYGKKNVNPVNNMRFYRKNSPSGSIAKRADESKYETCLPRSFEELSVRIFLRNPSKEHAARQAGDAFCEEERLPTLIQSQIEQQGAAGGAEGVDDDDEDDDNDNNDVGGSSSSRSGGGVLDSSFVSTSSDPQQISQYTQNLLRLGGGGRGGELLHESQPPQHLSSFTSSAAAAATAVVRQGQQQQQLLSSVTEMAEEEEDGV